MELIKQDWQGDVDLVIYSLASPRRLDPVTGEDYRSVLKQLASLLPINRGCCCRDCG
ncbi:hypothetical protein [Piscirickettsia salmonis]|uniref:hypothetical protein n=1 Tax=Piscirickettsia salmonis TaxID=1238 RepID=UPI0023675DB5|nr:hypothetical protein [Piscirickettsia salmonis]